MSPRTKPGAPRRAAIGALLAAALLALGRPAASSADPGVSGYPGSIASTGDSMTQAWQTCPTPYTGCPLNSWSTGWNPAINSHYTRILAANPAISGQNFIYAAGGTKMNALNSQALLAVAQQVDYVTVLMGPNDVCASSVETMTSVATYASQFQAAMNTLSSGLPDARIFIASVPDIYRLWEVLHTDPAAVAAWDPSSGHCQSLLANPTSMAQADVDRRAAVRQRNIDYNTQLQQICAQYVHCRFDGNAVFDHAFGAADVSTVDYFHLNIAGGTALASVTWSATFNFTDTTLPVSAATSAPAVGGIDVTITATDDVGVSGVEYRIGAGPWVRYTAPVLVPAGSAITYRAVDVNGNIEATKSVSAGAPGAVGGIAEAPDVAALPVRDGTAAGGGAAYAIGVMIVAVVGVLVAGARAVRRRV